MRRILTATITTAVCTLLSVVTLAQAPTAAQRQQMAEANKLKAQVTSQINGRKYEDANEADHDRTNGRREDDNRPPVGFSRQGRARDGHNGDNGHQRAERQSPFAHDTKA